MEHSTLMRPASPPRRLLDRLLRTEEGRIIGWIPLLESSWRLRPASGDTLTEEYRPQSPSQAAK